MQPRAGISPIVEWKKISFEVAFSFCKPACLFTRFFIEKFLYSSESPKNAALETF